MRLPSGACLRWSCLANFRAWPSQVDDTPGNLAVPMRWTPVPAFQSLDILAADLRVCCPRVTDPPLPRSRCQESASGVLAITRPVTSFRHDHGHRVTSVAHGPYGTDESWRPTSSSSTCLGGA